LAQVSSTRLTAETLALSLLAPEASIKQHRTALLFQVHPNLSFSPLRLLTPIIGGAWAQTSFIFNNFPRVTDLVLGNAKLNESGWLLQLDLVSPGGQNLTAPGNQAFIGQSFFLRYKLNAS
jgi:hypothetical protein